MVPFDCDRLSTRSDVMPSWKSSFLLRAVSVPFALLYIENPVHRAICCAVSY